MRRNDRIDGHTVVVASEEHAAEVDEDQAS